MSASTITHAAEPMTLDLFGVPIDRCPEPCANAEGRRRVTRPRGYAAPPGSGPAGETCRTCAHYSGHRTNKIFRKCGLLRSVWTHGPGTDILARSPACARWEKPKPEKENHG